MNKRKILFLFITIIFLASNYAYSEERYYYGFDTKIPITIIPIGIQQHMSAKNHCEFTL